MSNPADKIQTNSAGIGRDLQGVDNLRARDILHQAVNRLRWPGQITDDKVKDDDGNEIKGKYKIKVGGFTEDLDGYTTRPDETYKKDEVVEVTVDKDQVAWILSPSLPRAHGKGLCLMIIDDKDPGTWGVSYPFMLSDSSFGLE